MPRDGSGIYTLPYPAVVDGTTIESAVHNGTMSDFALQLNGPVPIVAGGTGANNAASALTNLGAEVRMQQVTNYDTHVFVAGSFFSNPGTTGEPVASHSFMGTAVLTSANQIILEARDQTDNEQLWTRRKNTSWGSWVKQGGRLSDLDAAYVNVSGDTMTGDLTLTGAKITAPANNHLFGGANGVGYSVPPPDTDANILLYRQSATNWAGIGTDSAGHMWLKTGTAGSPEAAAVFSSIDQRAFFKSTVAATSSTVAALTVSGGVGIGGALYTNGNVPLTHAGATTTGAAVFGSKGLDNGFHFNTTSLNATFASGLSINGSYAASISTVNLYASGVASAGAYAGELAFGVTSTTSRVEVMRLKSTGLSIAAGLTVSGAITVNSASATVTPNIIRAGAVIDPAAGRGFSLGIASTTDSGIGYTDVTYSFAYSSGVANCPVASVAAATTNQSCTIGVPATNAVRIHCVVTNTGTLTDPQYYTFHAIGS
jgi:hypothetical protein